MEITLTTNNPNGLVQAFDEGAQAGELTFQIKEKVIVIDHTQTFKGFERRGIAEQMTLAAIDYAKTNHKKIIPECSYAYTYLMRHREYACVLDERVIDEKRY
ncbi:MAG: GNAT family N-acetyltransferase [Prevotella sp.]|nr:N-acetyltransferase [Prevotella sp.]MDD7272492.1 GNAT family N-acetyltransferase [Prevotellaceae bacterium]MDY3936481.1 GNAT family N-acetyltransferase [Prevotella sp.]MDY4217579.1 GNAT family N-acetyltransferase [Prevotella sp.]